MNVNFNLFVTQILHVHLKEAVSNTLQTAKLARKAPFILDRACIVYYRHAQARSPSASSPPIGGSVVT